MIVKDIESGINYKRKGLQEVENYKNGGKFLSDNELRKEITMLKKTELIWLNEVSNNVAKQAVKDACNAYKNFFKV